MLSIVKLLWADELSLWHSVLNLNYLLLLLCLLEQFITTVSAGDKIDATLFYGHYWPFNAETVKLHSQDSVCSLTSWYCCYSCFSCVLWESEKDLCQSVFTLPLSRLSLSKWSWSRCRTTHTGVVSGWFMSQAKHLGSACEIRELESLWLFL